jgi:4-amino-4-deoxy-L-arabinose transferase-like glycosyltransferase
VHRPLPLAALLLVAAVAFAGLESAAVGSHPDEGLYLALGREMHQTGAWITPTVDGLPDFSKPPLLDWAMRVSFLLFGLTLWAARLPVALATIALAWMAGRLAREEVDAEAEPLAVLFTGTSLGALRYGRLAMLDVPLALALAVGLACVWRVARGGSQRGLLGAGVAGAAAVLLKGPVGALLLVLIAVWWLFRRRPEALRSPWLPAAFALGGALAAPWYVAMAHRHGSAFLGQFFGAENLGKFRFPWTVGGELVLLAALPVLFLPWTLRIRPAGPGAALAWPWIAVVMGVFSLPGLKHAHYVVPALVPLAVLASGPATSWGRRGTAVLLAVVALLCFLLLGLRLPFAAALGLGLGASLVGAAAWLVARERPLAGAAAVSGAAVLVLAVVLPSAIPAPVPREAWGAVAGRAVYTASENPGLLSFLAGRSVHRVHGVAATQGVLDGGGVLILGEDEEGQLPAGLRQGLRTVASWRRLKGRLSPRSVLDAWRAGTLDAMCETARMVQVDGS